MASNTNEGEVPQKGGGDHEDEEAEESSSSEGAKQEVERQTDTAGTLKVSVSVASSSFANSNDSKTHERCFHKT